MNDHTGVTADIGTRVGIGAAGTSWTLMGLPMSFYVGLITIVYLGFSTVAVAPKAIANLKAFWKWVRRG